MYEDVKKCYGPEYGFYLSGSGNYQGTPDEAALRQRRREQQDADRARKQAKVDLSVPSTSGTDRQG